MRLLFYPIIIVLAIYTVMMSLDAARLNDVASTRLDLSGSTELAWKAVLERLTFRLYSGGSDEKAEVQALYAESQRREQNAVNAALTILVLSVVFLAVLSWRGRSASSGGIKPILADVLAIAFIALLVGIISPILALTAYTTLPVLGTVILKYEAKSVLSTISTLFENRNFFIAMLVALFSVVTPLLKMLASAAMFQQRRGTWHERGIAFTRAIGKWSMADVFVVAVLIAYFAASSDEFSEASAGIGLYFFAVYCLLSQVAAHLLVHATDNEAPRE